MVLWYMSTGACWARKNGGLSPGCVFVGFLSNKSQESSGPCYCSILSLCGIKLSWFPIFEQNEAGRDTRMFVDECAQSQLGTTV